MTIECKESPQERPLNLEQAGNLIVGRARQLVGKTIQERGHDRPPFVSAEFARSYGIRSIEKAKLGQMSGVLLKVHDGYVIKLNEEHPEVRQNFSCAHEIGHILFNELNLERYVQAIEYRRFNPTKEREARAVARERLCDIAATELLMPDEIFGKYLSVLGVSVQSIEPLAKTFKVSRTAAAIRIAEVGSERCLALLWKPRPVNKPKELRLQWRAGCGMDIGNRVNYMPKNKSDKSPSPLFEAYETDRITKTFRAFNINNNVERLPLESKGYGTKEQRYVVSLAFPA